MNIPDSDYPRILIIGGGFAGVNLAKALANKPLQVVLLDQHNYHTFQPLLYQVSSAGLEPDSIAYPLRKILRHHKQSFFRLAKVEHIDVDKKEVHSNIGSLSFDYLVLATGTKTNFFGNQTIEQYSMPMKKLHQALNIRSLILQNFEKASILKAETTRQAHLNFVIVGGGPTGVELAGALAELKNHILPREYRDLEASKMQIHLVEGNSRVLMSMSEHASKKAEAFLKALGVQVHMNTYVSKYDGKTVLTNSDLKLEAETLIWAAGVTGNPVHGLSASSLFELSNRYKVNRFNQVAGYDTIFAVGDIALMSTEVYPNGHPQVAQPAIQQARLLGKNIMRLLEGNAMQAFVYKDKGSMATIGRNKAVVDLKQFKFAGIFAWFVWMFIHLMALVGFRNRVIVFFNWTYNYINFDKAARLIIRPFKKVNSEK